MNKELDTKLVVTPPAKQNERGSVVSVMFDPESMNSAMTMAKLMSQSTITVPNHLREKPSDCLAIILQAMSWGMNPFVVAQKTHLVNGTLGYEAQLVNAVVQSQGHITGSFTYEYKGEGQSLSCRVGAVLKGENKITYGQWLCIAEVTIQNSPLWKTNPKQQIGYLQVKNFARAYCPSAILGVYTPDELDTTPPRNVTPAEPAAPAEPVYYTDDEFAANSDKWQQIFLNGHKRGKTTEDFIAWAEQKGTLLTAEQKTTINSWTPIEGDAETVQADTPDAPDAPEATEFFKEADAKKEAQTKGNK